MYHDSLLDAFLALPTADIIKLFIVMTGVCALVWFFVAGLIRDVRTDRIRRKTLRIEGDTWVWNELNGFEHRSKFNPDGPNGRWAREKGKSDSVILDAPTSSDRTGSRSGSSAGHGASGEWGGDSGGSGD